MHGTSRQVLPSYLEVRRVQKAFHVAAEEKGLDRRRRQIYRSWILGFLCWCSARPPHRASSDRIRPFLRSIRRHPDSEPSHEAQATGALNFLFDSVRPHLEEGLSLFTTGIFRSEDGASPPHTETVTDRANEGQTPAERESGAIRKEGESPPPKRSSSNGKHGTLRLSLSEEQVRRLQQVAGHLELPPELVAQRAVDLICREAGTPPEEPPSKERDLSTGTLLYQNQARIDLLSANQNGRKEDDSLEDDQWGDGKGGDVLPGPDATLTQFR